MGASISESKAMAAEEYFNSIHPINLTPLARIWKKLKTKHDGIVLVFQPGYYCNILGRHSDVSHNRYACYGNDAEVLNRVMGCPIDRKRSVSTQKIEVDKVEVLECFVKVTH